MSAEPRTEPRISAAAPAAPRADAAAVDERNPWLGLASFTEETRQFFFGRDDEVAELARRVQRKLLTVLFGQSGLGKTSILRAGLVPRLRTQGHCPVYVRIDYAREAPEPSEQIKQAIVAAAQSSGQWTQAGGAVAGESLWEFLHHRDDVLRSAAGATLTPLLIFDQFEEIFTLAQSDDFGRARAARFIADLSDLVENRPPKALEARLEQDDTTAERFDFSRSDYRVVIALREDYLAPLEGLKGAMPSITQNRLRLAPMTGQQALAAVLQPGHGLVSEEVAAAIVRFVAGGAEIANAEVEPSLLSLICRELNDARIEQGRSEISLDLLAGSHATILSNFYQRALADQPAAVRQIIEERLDVRRVELTHDVLCGVVKASRDERHEREQREATEQLLAEQRARELAARRALVRARKVATVCGALALGAIIAAVLAVFSTRRALKAEHEAQQTRQESEQARAGAEQLLGFLSDDFARELESFGRLNSVADFSKRQIDYFHSLPAALRGPETTRNATLAMVHYAHAERILGDLDTAGASATEAIGLLERLRAAGDHSEATAIALTQSLTTQGSVLDVKNDAAGPQMTKRGIDQLQPLADAPGASAGVRRTYAEALMRRGWEVLNENQNEEAIRVEQRSMQIWSELGARDLSNVEAAANYAEAAAWLITAQQNLNRNADARRIGEDAVALTDKVLAQRPGYRVALHAAQVIGTVLAGVAANELDPKEAIRIGLRDEQVAHTLVSLDPKSTVSTNNLGVIEQVIGDSYWSAGQPRDAGPYYRRMVDNFRLASAAGGGQILLYAYQAAYGIGQFSQLGDFTTAETTLAAEAPIIARLHQEPASNLSLMVESLQNSSAAVIALEREQLLPARDAGIRAVTALQAMKPQPGFEDAQLYVCLFIAGDLAGRAEYLLGDFAAAEKYERIAVEARQKYLTDAVPDRRDLMIKTAWLAAAIARQGRLDEAAKLIGPAVTYQRQLLQHNHGDQWVGYELALSLHAQALTDAAKRAALLREAASLLDAAPAQIRALHDTRQWRQRIESALHGQPSGSA